VRLILAYVQPDGTFTRELARLRCTSRVLYRFVSVFICRSYDICVSDLCVRGLPNLTDLYISDWKLTMAVTRGLSRLQTLRIYCNYKRPTPHLSSYELFKPLAPTLHTLQLEGPYNGIDASGFDCLTGLRRLVLLGQTKLGDAVLSQLTRLESLDILTTDGHCHWDITDKGLAPLTQLKSLHIAQSPMISYRALAGMRQLRELNISHHDNDSHITPDGVFALSASLTSLDMSCNSRIPALLLPRLTNLVTLDITGVLLPSPDRIEQMTTLRVLTMNNQDCTPGIRFFAECYGVQLTCV
jgi:hypothetical protein